MFQVLQRMHLKSYINSRLTDTNDTPHVQAPAPEPLNLTAVLEKGGPGQFTTLSCVHPHLRTARKPADNSDQGLTLYAPTYNAFNNLKPRTLNALSQQQQVALLLYHVLRRFNTVYIFDAVSNPVRTVAGGNDSYGFNFTTSANQVNVSTCVVGHVPINHPLRYRFPSAAYQLDQVLLPLDLFGPKNNKTEAPPASSLREELLLLRKIIMS
ncbi:hypothetical protein ACLOJK_009774 [Asimina triloba]